MHIYHRKILYSISIVDAISEGVKGHCRLALSKVFFKKFEKGIDRHQKMWYNAGKEEKYQIFSEKT